MKRYIPYGCDLHECDNGKWVLYADAQAELARVRDAALEEAAKACEAVFPSYQNENADYAAAIRQLKGGEKK